MFLHDGLTPGDEPGFLCFTNEIYTIPIDDGKSNICIQVSHV
jgi:hypothetical protein